jgi:hypothetical protein
MDTVNTSNNAQIVQVLSEIRDLYGTLCAMTKRFLDEFSIPALHDLLRERARVLLKIGSEEEGLLRIAEVRCLRQYGEYGEITGHIAAILSCDREIAARVTQGMKTVKRELSSLSATANAAITYTRHTRG